jgi:hypothetical protein
LPQSLCGREPAGHQSHGCALHIALHPSDLAGEPEPGLCPEPKLAIRDPYVFEFLGLRAKDAVAESDLEAALIEHMREFLLELGHGFCLEAQQKSIVIGKTPEGTGGGTSEELKQQILDVALERAFLLEPLPNDEASFKRRVDEGRGRLTLIANEVARLAGGILLEFGAAARKIKDTKNAPEATADCAQQLQRLMPKHFMAATSWPQLQHYARYLKAITLRLDKYRADPSRDTQRLTELKPLEQKYWRLVAERKGQTDARMLEFRWLLEELRVSFFAQELRTPQPVSIKRLEKAWAQFSH